MRNPRKPKWDECNLLSRHGIDNTDDNWRVVKRNREYIIIWNRKTGSKRELELGGKVKPKRTDTRLDTSERLAREMRSRRQSNDKA